ncbi:alkane 1-monooxygenase [Pseudoprimorskyibacter insulae]|uniref:Alkane 1-monooxygenase 2 n=1 Tax=Pseudoprimorskyibacter insulae TaxID=1695997 RepID=A0A2R8AQY9_9RHOB|nr:alkane 1-monooxygenase [Pseudoprimorskyibacter insulae]SPF78297.1 Alkane 1-monooxygenase 2 [Pseudoprimorskyibacter insulae]
MIRFATITLSAAVFVLLAALFGGIWPGIALFYITAFSFFMDKLIAATPDAPEGSEFPAGKTLSTVLGLLHFPVFFGGIVALAVPGHLDTVNKILLFIALSLFVGQVSNSNAHELIHRSSRWVRRLGAAVYTSILFGHHTSGHLRVHHVQAATYPDPNSARMGETFYHFLFRAWMGSFCMGREAETKRYGRDLKRHPYTWYVLGGAASVLLAALLAGWQGALWMLATSTYAQVQLLLSDYILHYGLQRKLLENGKFEPVGPRHSWNTPHWFSSAIMLNASRHSDHHAHPTRPYTQLRLDTDTMPILPFPIPAMAVIAFWPKLWFRVMNRRAKAWAA